MEEREGRNGDSRRITGSGADLQDGLAGACSGHDGRLTTMGERAKNNERG